MKYYIIGKAGDYFDNEYITWNVSYGPYATYEQARNVMKYLQEGKKPNYEPL